MIKFFILVIFTTLFVTKVFATNIAVIDVNFLINNSNHFKEISEKINNSQKKYTENFKSTENNLIETKKELEDLKLILSEEEFNSRKDEYYKNVSKFENRVSNFNNHYENEVAKIKNIIFSKISQLIQEHASKNDIKLVLEKNQYLIAAEKINISDVIFVKLNESKIELNFKEYED